MDNQDVMACDICTENYDNEQRKPKFMTCHHTFCEYCLNKVAGDKDNIECPTCRQVTNLADGGVRGLQTNFYIIHMKETFEKIGSPKMKGCPNHSNQPMSFFVETKMIHLSVRLKSNVELRNHRFEMSTSADFPYWPPRLCCWKRSSVFFSKRIEAVNDSS